MAGATVDRRAVRTKRKLKEVLINLLQTRELEKISIRELAELADISRGTFYLHFTDIFDLYQAVEDDVVNGITERVDKSAVPADEFAIETMMESILEYLTQHIDACEALLRTDSASFLAHVFERNKPSKLNAWEAVMGTDEHIQEYAYVFVSYGFAGILRTWIADGRRESPKQIAKIVNQLLAGYRMSLPS